MSTEVTAVYADPPTYGVDYTVDVFHHPHFQGLSTEAKLLILEGSPRRKGTSITMGGCREWTQEQFLDTVAHKEDVNEALAACLTEPNFVSEAFKVTDFEAAKARLAAHRQERIARIRKLLAAEGFAQLLSQGGNHEAT